MVAVSSHGKIMHYDSFGWAEKNSHTLNQLHSIFGISANEMYTEKGL